MFGHELEHEQFRKHISIIGNIFNGLKIYRRDAAGNRIQTLAVPIEYAERSKFLTRVVKDPSLLNQAITLPRISFEIMGITRDPNRQQNPLNRRLQRHSADRLYSEREPVAYTMDIELSIYAKTSYDLFQTVENILPYFQPSLHVSVKNMAEGMEKPDDIRFVLTGSERGSQYEGAFEDRRLVIWVMHITAFTQFHPIVSKQGVIKKVIVNFFTSASETFDVSEQASRLTLTPGLTATGEPTSDPDEAIHYLNVTGDDAYGFIERWDDLLTGTTVYKGA